MKDITVEELVAQQQRLAYCASVTLPPNELAPLLHLAMRTSIANNEIITRLLRAATEGEAKITGDDIRMIIDLALQAKRLEKNPRQPTLKAVQSPKKV